MRAARTAGAFALALALLPALPPAVSGCSRERPQPETSAKADVKGPLTAAEVWIDAANGPRGAAPLVAGEPLKLGLRIRGGEPPYRVELAAKKEGPQSSQGSAALAAEIVARPESTGAIGVEVGAAGAADASAGSGTYRLHARVRDNAGREAEARSAEFELLGRDAPVLGPTGNAGVAAAAIATDASALEVLDAAGRRRAWFVRGERVLVRAQLGGAPTTMADLVLRGPGGEVIARREDLGTTGGQLEAPLEVPRLAVPGRYRLDLELSGDTLASGELIVHGTPFAPLRRLRVDELHLYGGPELRAPRASLLARGETIRVDARIGGGRRTVVGRVKLRRSDGLLVLDRSFAEAPIRRAGADVRVYVGGEVTVPSNLLPGNYMLEVEAREGDDVSSIYRQVRVQ